MLVTNPSSCIPVPPHLGQGRSQVGSGASSSPCPVPRGWAHSSGGSIQGTSWHLWGQQRDAVQGRAVRKRGDWGTHTLPSAVSRPPSRPLPLTAGWAVHVAPLAAVQPAVVPLQGAGALAHLPAAARELAVPYAGVRIAEGGGGDREITHWSKAQPLRGYQWAMVSDPLPALAPSCPSPMHPTIHSNSNQEPPPPMSTHSHLSRR